MRQSAATACVEDNQLTIRYFCFQHSLGLGLVMVLVLLVLAVVYLLVNTVLTNLSTVDQGLVTGLVCVFTWVTLWDPLEALLFE